jgi:hypothetical protein
MGLSDGQVIGTVKVIDHGPPSRRFNLVLVSEGYQSSELGSFTIVAQQFIDYLFSTPPFDNLKCAFNIYRIDVSSSESGADNPSACGGDGSVKATRFDASFCNSGIQRLLCVNSQAVIDVTDAAMPEWHQILVIVNSTIYGGSGGHVAVTSTGGTWKSVAVHEIGHAVFGLADEYPYWAGCSIDTTRNRYTGAEPFYPNVTINTDRNTLKWKDLIDPVTPVPTTINADCSKCDPQADPFPAGTVGLYEGARYYHCGIYRPEFNCMMKDLSGFCSVCRKRITETMSVYLDKCYAPVFKPVPFIIAFFLVLVLSLIVVILSLFAPFSGKIKCLIKRLIFIIKNCTAGNSNSCISL